MNESQRRSPSIDLSSVTISTESRQVSLLVALTFVSGTVDSVSYLNLGHVFTSNMTGNWVLLGFSLGGSDSLPVGRSFLCVAGFLLGAVVAGRIAKLLPARDGQAWPASVSLGLSVTAGTMIAAVVTWFIWGRGGSPTTMSVLAFLLAAAMGAQGGSVRQLGVADLPTTVLTSTVTGLFGDSAFGTGLHTRWRRRAAAVIALLLGGITGALLDQGGPPMGLMVGICVVVTVIVVGPRLCPFTSNDRLGGHATTTSGRPGGNGRRNDSLPRVSEPEHGRLGCASSQEPGAVPRPQSKEQK